ncbi:MAG: hypothetical protein RBR22_00630 [Desulfuromonas sp.]|nr:hypothetical protein [Desulfuromonas sp.]
MSKKHFHWRGRKFFAVIAATYLFTYLYAPHIALTAAQTSGAIFRNVVPIIAVVITFSAIINSLLPPHIMVKHLGKNSGGRGWAIALCAGVISHGPMYIWYPMIEDLRQHGVRDALLVAFFYSRAIKLPLLPLMIDYFGWGFTAILTIYILIAAVLQGWLMEKLWP